MFNKVRIVVLLFLTLIMACKKDDNNHAGHTKVRAVTKIERLDLIYNDKGQLEEMRTNLPVSDERFYLIYNNSSRLSHIVKVYHEPNWGNHSTSTVFSYDSNGDVTRVNYKGDRPDLPIPDPYFSDLSDNMVQDRYDSLTYTNNHLIENIYVFERRKLKNIYRFYYNAQNNPLRLDLFNVTDGVSSLYDQIEVTTDEAINVYNTFWFQPLISHGGAGGVDLPILVNEPSTYLNDYLTLFKKRIISYSVNNNWGFDNYKNSPLIYKYNQDSSRLQISDQYGANEAKLWLEMK